MATNAFTLPPDDFIKIEDFDGVNKAFQQMFGIEVDGNVLVQLVANNKGLFQRKVEMGKIRSAAHAIEGYNDFGNDYLIDVKSGNDSLKNCALAFGFYEIEHENQSEYKLNLDLSDESEFSHLTRAWPKWGGDGTGKINFVPDLNKFVTCLMQAKICDMRDTTLRRTMRQKLWESEFFSEYHMYLINPALAQQTKLALDTETTGSEPVVEAVNQKGDDEIVHSAVDTDKAAVVNTVDGVPSVLTNPELLAHLTPQQSTLPGKLGRISTNFSRTKNFSQTCCQPPATHC